MGDKSVFAFSAAGFAVGDGVDAAEIGVAAVSCDRSLLSFPNAMGTSFGLVKRRIHLCFEAMTPFAMEKSRRDCSSCELH